MAPSGDTHADFSKVAEQAAPEALGSGISEAMRSGQDGGFAAWIEKLFAGSTSEQRAGILGQLIQSIKPGVPSSLAEGALAKF